MRTTSFVVVIDANVLFPLTLRDTMLRAAAQGFFQLRWTKDILDEMERNLVSSGTITVDQANHLRSMMETYFPDATVTDYAQFIDQLSNDRKDRHVVAAAVKAGAQVIATINLKDFAPLPDGIEAQHPDQFLANLFDLDQQRFVNLLHDQAEALRKPPITFDMLLVGRRQLHARIGDNYIAPSGFMPVASISLMSL